MSSKDEIMSNCLHCQIREYATADIVVGLHGAGETTFNSRRPLAYLLITPIFLMIRAYSKSQHFATICDIEMCQCNPSRCDQYNVHEAS